MLPSIVAEDEEFQFDAPVVAEDEELQFDAPVVAEDEELQFDAPVVAEDEELQFDAPESDGPHPSDCEVAPEPREGQVAAEPAATAQEFVAPRADATPPLESNPEGRVDDTRPTPVRTSGTVRRLPSAGWTVRSIPVNAISSGPGRRSVSRKWLPDLVRSIAVDGLISPILVRPVKGGKKPYELVAGLHRLHACRKLGWAEIEATVTDLDDPMASVAADVENLWCNPLRGLQFDQALARWEAHYQLRYPETVQYRAGGIAKANKARTEVDRKAADESDQGRVSGADGSDGKAPCFAEVVANGMGTTRRTAERALKRSRTFSNDDRELFQQCDVTSVQQDAIATIKDSERRAECLWDIGQGLDANEAIARYKGSAGARAADAIGLDVERGQDGGHGVAGEVLR